MASREEIDDYSPYLLAEMAGVRAPDSHTSPGAVFLSEVRQFVFDPESEQFRIRDTDDAGGSVTHKTHQAWQIFADLSAYEVADEVEEAEETRPEMTTEGAQYVLGFIAERLAQALRSDLDDDTEEED